MRRLGFILAIVAFYGAFKLLDGNIRTYSAMVLMISAYSMIRSRCKDEQ